MSKQKHGLMVVERVIGDRMKSKLKLILPYIGIPVIGMALIMMRGGDMDKFILLHCLLLMVFGYIATVFDIKSKRIPNDLILVMLGGWVVTIGAKLLLDTDVAITLLTDAGLGFIIGGGLFLLVYIISRKGLGGGDVKFMAATGLYTGVTGVISVMLYGTVLASLTGLVLLLTKKMGRKDTMPLVPFLYFGILIAIFYR